MKDISFKASSSKPKSNTLFNLMKQEIECTGCNKQFPKDQLLQCSQGNCRNAFCYNCSLSRNFGVSSLENFDEMISSGKWICLLCQNEKETEKAGGNQMENNNLLNRKSQRISYKLKQIKPSKKTKTKQNSNAKIIQNTIIKMIYHSIKKVDKIKEPVGFEQLNKFKIVGGDNDNNNENYTDNANNKNTTVYDNDIQKKKYIKNSIDKTKEAITSKTISNRKLSLETFFANFHENKSLNAIIIKSAVIAHSCRVHKGSRKGKPCSFCGQSECPNGIEMVKFKKYEDLICFFNIFFSEIELNLTKESSKDLDFYKMILREKEYLFKIQDNISGIKGRLMNNVKTFCSNCIANAFRQYIGVYSIFNSCFTEGEQSSFNITKTLNDAKEAMASFVFDKDKSLLINKEFNSCLSALQLIDDKYNTIINKGLIDLHNEYNDFNQSLNQSLDVYQLNNAQSSFSNESNEDIANCNINNDNNQLEHKAFNKNGNKEINNLNNDNINNNDQSFVSQINSVTNNDLPHNNTNNKTRLKKKNEIIQKTRSILLKHRMERQLVPEKKHNFLITPSIQMKRPEIDLIQPQYPYSLLSNQPSNTFIIPNSYAPPFTYSLNNKSSCESLIQLYCLYKDIYQQYNLPIEHLSFQEESQLASLINLVSLMEKTIEANSKYIKDQLQYELSKLNEKTQQKKDLLSQLSLELTELQKYLSSFPNQSN